MIQEMQYCNQNQLRGCIRDSMIDNRASSPPLEEYPNTSTNNSTLQVIKNKFGHEDEAGIHIEEDQVVFFGR